MNQRQNANIGRTRREEGNNKRDQDNIVRSRKRTRTEKCKPVGYVLGGPKVFGGFLSVLQKNLNKTAMANYEQY